METKMTTQEKAAELVQDLGIDHAIYVTEEILTILKDWEGTELAQKDWVEIEEIIRSMKKLTFKPYKEQILVQSSIDGEVIWEDKEEQQYCIVCGQEFDYDDECPTGHVQK